jgi:hypothetical protein
MSLKQGTVVCGFVYVAFEKQLPSEIEPRRLGRDVALEIDMHANLARGAVK